VADASLLHIVSAFQTARRGSERAALHAAREMAALRPVRVWSVVPPPAEVLDQAAALGTPIETIRPFGGAMPRGGTLLLWGTHYGIGGWLAACGCARVAIVNELFDCANLYRHLLEVRAAGLPVPTVLHVSTLLRGASGIDGPVLYPTSDPAAFLAIPRPTGPPVVTAAAPVATVGRLSRDIADKHHRDDPLLYRALAARGVRVRLMGATVLAPALAGRPGIELLPEGALAPADFLAGLDIFWYRTAADGAYVEPSGVVIAEAMAAGLPVIAARPGGFEDLIEDGVTGFLVDGQDAACEAITALAGDPALRERIGAAARAQARRRFGPAYAQALVAVLAGTEPGSAHST
jgi:hypothetical protein